MTRSPGRIGAAWRNISDSASTKAAALRCVTATPLGVPVEPEVKMIQASSVRSGSSRTPESGMVPAVARTTRSAVTTAATPASPKTTLARSSGSSWSTGT
jgi:hypothetical protein